MREADIGLIRSRACDWREFELATFEKLGWIARDTNLEPAMLNRIFTAHAICALVAIAPAMAQTSGTTRMRGTIEKLDGLELSLKAEDGSLAAIHLAESYQVGSVAKASAADIKPGSYIGVGARPQPDGTLLAVQVMIFSEAQRGIGEGHRAWGVLPDATMTNATVADTIASVSGAMMKLTYKDGEKQLLIAPDAVVMALAPAQKADLKPGMAVLVSLSKGADGSLGAARVTYGRDGAALPM